MTVDVQRLNGFVVEKVLSKDPLCHSMTILGTLPSDEKQDSDQDRARAIVQIKKTPIVAKEISDVQGVFEKLHTLVHNDTYNWLQGWVRKDEDRSADMKITVVENATDIDIRKFAAQKTSMIRETPQMYAEVVKPYIDNVPSERLQLLLNMLSYESQPERILYDDASPKDGFILIPDVKWDGVTISTFYIQAIARARELRSLRDIRKKHIPMLREMRKQGVRVARDKYGLGAKDLRMFIHYQPGYYQFHVHIVTLELTGLPTANVGTAHLLDDVISLLDIEPDGLADDQGTFARVDMTYDLETLHELHDPLVARQVPLDE